MIKHKKILLVVLFGIVFSLFLSPSAEICSRVFCIALAEDPVSAKAYVVMDADTAYVAQQQNKDLPLPMASTTKIMTSLLTLEQPNLDQTFIVDSRAIMVEGTSMGLQKGDTVTLRTLAYGMLLCSGNDAANAAAVRIAQTIPAFATKMNERAAQIGMSNSHFVTPSGLHDDAHYSTAYDMALLTKAALSNPDFLKICASPKATVTFGTPLAKRTLSNHNRLLKEYDGCIGVKTGFTKKAGRCLVSAAKRNNVTLICVTLQAPNDWNDHTHLLNAGFHTIKAIPLTLQKKAITLCTVGGTQTTFTASPVGTILTTLPQSEHHNIQQTWLVRKFYYAPVLIGQPVGELLLRYQGKTLGTLLVTAQQTIAPV